MVSCRSRSLTARSPTATASIQPGLSYAGLLEQLGISLHQPSHTARHSGLRVDSGLGAHLDPDLRAAARPRPAGWRPLFGQSEAAQRHLSQSGCGRGRRLRFLRLVPRYRRRPWPIPLRTPPSSPAGTPPRTPSAAAGLPVHLGMDGNRRGRCPPMPSRTSHPWADGSAPSSDRQPRRPVTPGHNTMYMAAPHFSQDHLPGRRGNHALQHSAPAHMRQMPEAEDGGPCLTPSIRSTPAAR